MLLSRTVPSSGTGQVPRAWGRECVCTGFPTGVLFYFIFCFIILFCLILFLLIIAPCFIGAAGKEGATGGGGGDGGIAVLWAGWSWGWWCGKGALLPAEAVALLLGKDGQEQGSRDRVAPGD